MNGGVQKNVKHSLSSSSGKLPNISDPEHVKESTEIIFKFLLKDSIRDIERTISQSSGESQETDETTPSIQKQDSFGLDLDLPTDIVSDAISDGENDEWEANFKNVADRLGEIGDDFEKLYKEKEDFQKSLISCAQTATTESIYQNFEKSLENFLEDQKKYLPDASEKYQVALVFLCTKTALKLVNEPVTAASNSADIVISNAVNFVSNRFPRWLGGMQ